MRTLAQHLASQGRNGDDHLLHVSGAELSALQGLGALTGRHITTNPRTGLPEAFNWTSLLPIIAGVASTAMGMGPIGAGLVSGATAYATTGSLTAGLMSGVTAGAMGGIGEGIAGLGGAGAGMSSAATANGMADASLSSAGLASGGIDLAGLGTGMANPAADVAATSANPAMAGFQTPPAYSAPAVQPAPTGALGGEDMNGFKAAPDYTSSPAPATNGVNSISPQVDAAVPPSQFSGDTFMQNVTNPDKLKEAFGGENAGKNLKGGALALGALSAAMAPTPQMPQKKTYAAHPRAIIDRSYTPQSDNYYAMSDPYGNAKGPGEPNLFTASPVHYAAGGGVASLPNTIDDATMKKVRMIRSRYRSKDAAMADIQTPGSVMQQAGVLDANDPVMQYAFGYTANQGKGNSQGDKPGQFLAGGGMAGDGLSDSIPATIDGREPARLAANEFVLPSDVVSHLGNGSSDAGADQLHAMVARIRKARTGTDKQAPAINATKMLS